ncbi:hypothetical protein AB205_0084960 [Aquarana catesbeiana]|uniref:Elongation factor 1-gamma n=1 Tax=Aquarana catesbeiana TaxID=8400 RepID=A0A2G9QIF6_AQUCT|nr:hypothetical protein AB205_0084960 [Aquarana catesbeiana]
MKMAGGTLFTYPDNWRAYKPLIAAQYSGFPINVASSAPEFQFGVTNKTPEFLKKFPLGKATEQAKEELKHVLATLDSHLQTRTFLVGERVTLADITVACSLLWPYKQVLEPSFRQPYGNVTRWFVTCVNQPQFHAVLGEVKLCDKMAQFDAKKFAELQPKKETPKKEKPAKEQKKEEKKPAPAPAAAPEDDLDESEKALAAEPKSKDPYAHLPKSSFIMDEFKRKYSNEDTLSVALPYFWEHFDKEGWSIWYSEYRFPNELSQPFMSCNLITGEWMPIVL